MKLIKLSDTYYIIVDDSEINEGDYFLYGSSIYCADKGENKDFVYKNGIALSILSCKKITHSTEPLAYDEDGGYYPISVTAISLSEVEEAVNGYSVEKMAADNWDSQDMKYKDISEPWDFSFGYHQGFKAAMELTKDKLFTVEDMIHAFNEGTNAGAAYQSLCEDDSDEAERYSNDETEDFIKSILPKTEWDIELIDGKIKLI